MKKINCILLVDDNVADNVFHEIIIKEADVCNHIKIAISGQEALDYIIKSEEINQSENFPKPNIVFLDINMPGMNGFEFLEEYKKLDEKYRSAIIMIMLTTSLNPADKKRTLENNEVTQFLNKPLTVEMLHEIMKKYF